jgi:hypothetical protein
MRAGGAIPLLCAAGRVAMAQATPDTAAKPVPPIGVWVAATLGPGTASNRPNVTLIAGQLAAYASIGSWVAGYRRGGASGIDTGGAYDDALLVGMRVTEPFSTGFAVLGPSKIFDVSTGRGHLGVGFAAEAGANLRAAGLGASVFGAWSPRLSYVGLGLTLDVGWIR